jgi:hypothetical protein
LTHLVERVGGVLQIVFRDAARDSVGPLDLTVRDGIERRASARREDREFRSPVGGIVGVRHRRTDNSLVFLRMLRKAGPIR